MSDLTDPSLLLDIKDRSQSTATWPNRECHNVNGDVKDVDATMESIEERDDVLELGGVWS